ncbi:MAG: DUF6600 domain-containing protein, partial [Acidobacteriaceae bacterium]
EKMSALFFDTLLQLAFLLPGTAQAFPAEIDPPARVARLAQIAAQVSLEPAGTKQWTQAVGNTPLTTGDRVSIDPSGHAELQMGQLAVRAWKYTDLTLVNLTNMTTQLALAQGSLHVRTFSLDPQDNVEVDTSNGAITAIQPSDVRIDAYTSDGGTLVTVDSGAVEISGPGLSEVLGAGECLHLVGSDPVHVLRQRMPGKDPFDVWSQQRDRAFLSSATRRYVNPNTPGSEDLDPYGTWAQTPDYGPVWYPAGVSVNWSPYAKGHWTWISPWGWTWVDADAWGFAPFHYGRWIRIGSRWGWIPGPREVAPVYSPAMVAFVGGARFASDALPLSRWFPLGPGEPFYPSYFCTARYFTAVNLTNLRKARGNLNASNYFRYYHTRIGLHSIRYVNRMVGTIAVPSKQFAVGQEITADTAIHLTAQQRTSAWIVSHPMVAPTPQSLVPHPIASVPVPAERPELMTLPRQPEAALPPHATPGESSRLQPQPDDRLRLIARTPPPAASPGFEQRLPALSLDPGRPLDPGQVNNLAQGRPAGPASTAEFPPRRSSSPGAASHRNRGR